MSNITPFPGGGKPEQDLEISIQRTPAFYQAALELSQYIADLRLTREQNDKLIDLTIEQTLEAEKGALAQGLRWGYNA